jgi:hypothetical protein
MSFVTSLNIRDNEIKPAHIDETKTYSMSGLSACTIALGDAGSSNNPTRGLFDIQDSRNIDLFVHSTSANSDIALILKSPEREWRMTNSGTASNNLIISSSGSSGGIVCIPNLCVASLSASGPGLWTESSDDIYFNSGQVTIGGTTTRGTGLTVENGCVIISNQCSVAGSVMPTVFNFCDNAGAQVNAARIIACVQSGAAGAECSQLLFQTMGGGSLATAMTIDNTGNVGIGTGSPGLAGDGVTVMTGGIISEIDGGTGHGRQIVSGDTGARIGMIDRGGASNDKHFSMRVDAGIFKMLTNKDDNSGAQTDNIFVADLGTGNVGIGTATPGFPLEVTGTICNTGTVETGGQFISTATCTNVKTAATFINSGTAAGCNVLIALCPGSKGGGCVGIVGCYAGSECVLLKFYARCCTGVGTGTAKLMFTVGALAACAPTLCISGKIDAGACIQSSTCMTTLVVCGTTCVGSPVICGISVIGGSLCAVGDVCIGGNICTSVNQVLGADLTAVVVCATGNLCSAGYVVVNGEICAAARICSSVCLISPSICSTGKFNAGTCVTAGTCMIATTCVVASVDLCAAFNVTAGGYICAVGAIHAGGTICSDGLICAGTNSIALIHCSSTCTVSSAICSSAHVTAGGVITGTPVCSTTNLVTQCAASAIGTGLGQLIFQGCNDASTNHIYGFISTCIMSGANSAECACMSLGIAYQSACQTVLSIRTISGQPEVQVAGCFCVTACAVVGGNLCSTGSICSGTCLCAVGALNAGGVITGNTICANGNVVAASSSSYFCSSGIVGATINSMAGCLTVGGALRVTGCICSAAAGSGLAAAGYICIKGATGSTANCIVGCTILHSICATSGLCSAGEVCSRCHVASANIVIMDSNTTQTAGSKGGMRWDSGDSNITTCDYIGIIDICSNAATTDTDSTTCLRFFVRCNGSALPQARLIVDGTGICTSRYACIGCDIGVRGNVTGVIVCGTTCVNSAAVCTTGIINSGGLITAVTYICSQAITGSTKSCFAGCLVAEDFAVTCDINILAGCLVMTGASGRSLRMIQDTGPGTASCQTYFNAYTALDCACAECTVAAITYQSCASNATAALICGVILFNTHWCGSTYGVRGCVGAGGVLEWGYDICTTANVCAGGDLVAPSKTFQINHPCRNAEVPNKYNAKVLKHVVSEAPEYNVFYRGTAHLCNGIAIVELPEYFEALVHEEDRTISLTPVFGWSPLVVKSRVVDNQFEVCTTTDGDDNQEFDWRVDARRNDEYIKTKAVEKGNADENARFIPVQLHDNARDLSVEDVAEIDDDELKQILKRSKSAYNEKDSRKKLLKSMLNEDE